MLPTQGIANKILFRSVCVSALLVQKINSCLVSVAAPFYSALQDR